MIAFSRKYKVGYYLNPIDTVELQPIENLTSEDDLQINIDELNQWLIDKFGVSIQVGIVQNHTISGVSSLIQKLCSVYLIHRLRLKVDVTRLSLLDAYFETKVNPETWKLIEGEPIAACSRKDSQKRVHIHLRLSTFSNSSDRKVDLDYYRSILNELTDTANLEGYQLQIIVHTDFLGSITERQSLIKHAVPQSLIYWVKLGLLQEDFFINSDLLNSAREALTSFLSQYPSSEVFNDKSWVSEWSAMASADFLVISKSSFSIVGGLINPLGIKYVPKSWELAVPGWIGVHGH